jgi:transcriptional regulator GlxA family with amidase domain
MAARVIVIVVFDAVTMLDVAGAGEVFAEANRAGADYQLKIASVDGNDVTTSIGSRLGVTDGLTGAARARKMPLIAACRWQHARARGAATTRRWSAEPETTSCC